MQTRMGMVWVDNKEIARGRIRVARRPTYSNVVKPEESGTKDCWMGKIEHTLCRILLFVLYWRD